jgi:hypothetical protein
MRVIKMLGVALLGLAALVSVGANAQQVSVPCVWQTISSEGNPNGSSRYITQQCKESNSSLVATRKFVWIQGQGVISCDMSYLAPGVSYTGNCLEPTSPSFFRSPVSSSSAQSSSAASSISACATSGRRVQGGCANSYNSSMLTNPTIVARCGSGCSLEYRTIGWTSACPNSGNGRSPEYGLFCK